MPTVSEGYILGTSQATSMILPLLGLLLATLLFVIHFDYFMSPRAARTIFLESSLG